MTGNDLPAQFMEKAALVSAIIHEPADIKDALEKTIDICLKKPPCKNLLPGKSPDTSKRIISAPNLGENEFIMLEKLCSGNGIKLVDKDLRNYPGGIDIGFTIVDYGIAETGTLVLNSDSEEVRLSTMLCEIHVAVLPKSRIRQSALAMADELGELTKQPSSYTAFITGASRTADIERVLALGVHGPLELHIMLMED